MPSHVARIEPSDCRAADDTCLQAGKLYLMIFDATAFAFPSGAAPTEIDAATAFKAKTLVANKTMVRCFTLRP